MTTKGPNYGRIIRQGDRVFLADDKGNREYGTVTAVLMMNRVRVRSERTGEEFVFDRNVLIKEDQG